MSGYENAIIINK